jgi:hypothetical protein
VQSFMMNAVGSAKGQKCERCLHRSSESSGPWILVWLRNWRPTKSSGKSRSLYFLIGCLVLRPFRYPSNLHRIVFDLCVHVPPGVDLPVRWQTQSACRLMPSTACSKLIQGTSTSGRLSSRIIFCQTRGLSFESMAEDSTSKDLMPAQAY